MNRCIYYATMQVDVEFVFKQRTDLEILGSTPFFSSSKFIVTGNVAVEDAVPKAVVKALVILAMNLKGS